MKSDAVFGVTNMTSGFEGKNPSWNLSRSQYDETDELPLMGGPGPIMMIWVLYILFVLKIGPNYMRNRDAFKLTSALIAYNALQVVVSAYLVQYCLTCLLKTGFTPKVCHMNDESSRRELIFGIWVYFAAKVSELFDTIFFVLRKKDNQVTFLHLYHHSVMMVGAWAYLKYWPSQNLFFIGFLNSLVHVFMYTYYGLAALGPNVAKYLTWKRHMTKMQLIQFVSIIIHYLVSVRRSDCPPAKGVISFVTFNTIFFLVLFLNFYQQSYVKKSSKKMIDDHCIRMDSVNGKTEKVM